MGLSDSSVQCQMPDAVRQPGCSGELSRSVGRLNDVFLPMYHLQSCFDRRSRSRVISAVTRTLAQTPIAQTPIAPTPIATPPRMRSLRTEAWLLRGISSIPGELLLRDGVLSFSATDTGSAWPWQLRKLERSLGVPGFAGALEKAHRRTLFRWPVRSMRFWVPWYYVGGGA